MTDIHLLRVFTDQNGDYGDVASVVIDEGRALNDGKRLALTKQLATGETIFINSVAQANISVIHPQGEIDFAGVGALAAAWLLAKLRGEPIQTMHARGKTITTWQEAELTLLQADLAAMPAWNFSQLDNPEAVNRLMLQNTKAIEHTLFWAWLDENQGLIQPRTFASDWDIPEAEGNGSGAMLLAARLGRKIELRHGQGSIIFAEPDRTNKANLGGRVIEEKQLRN